MQLLLKRDIFNEHSTLGDLYINGEFFCYTLEDKYRLDGIKIPKETCIPNGKYKIVIDWSERFQRRMPHLLDVPNFTGIRIHSGNTDKDTEGCIIVGMAKDDNKEWIGDSRMTYNWLFDRLDQVRFSEEIWITIITI